MWVGAGGDMVWRRRRYGGWWHSRIESLQVLSTLDFGLWTWTWTWIVTNVNLDFIEAEANLKHVVGADNLG